jgi:hypothetical protein
MVITPGSNQSVFSTRPVVFTLFCIMGAISLCRHELWGDELQCWNVLRSTSSLSTLLAIHHNLHPYLWSAIIFVLSRFCEHPEIMQLASWVIICGAAFVLVFYSSFPPVITTLVLCGYYFLFEYSSFSRGYALSVLFCFLLCREVKRIEGPRTTLYFLWLTLLASSHVLALFLAASFHLYFFLTNKNRRLGSHILPVLLLLLVAITLLLPEGGSQSAGTTWYSGIHPSIPMQAPLRAFIPIPVFWRAEFWNSFLVLEVMPWKMIQLIMSTGLVFILLFVFRNSVTVLLFFATAVVTMMLFALVFPMVSARYVGFLYLAFLCALWLGNFSSLDKNRRIIVFTLIILQIPGGFFAMTEDWIRPFSQYREVKALVNETKGAAMITDIWGLNYLAATYDTAFYCVETAKQERKVILSEKILEAIGSPDRYRKGVTQYFSLHGTDTLFLFSNNPGIDPLLKPPFSTKLVMQRENSIEKFSNIYLYKVWRTAR